MCEKLMEKNGERLRSMVDEWSVDDVCSFSRMCPVDDTKISFEFLCDLAHVIFNNLVRIFNFFAKKFTFIGLSAELVQI